MIKPLNKKTTKFILDVDNLRFKDKNGDRTPRQDKSELQALQAKCDQIVDEVCKKKNNT